MKDKKSLIGIGLIVVIMIGWGIFAMPSKAERERDAAKRKRESDSTLNAIRQQQIQDSIDLAKLNAPDTTLLNDSIKNLPDSLQQIAMDSVTNQDLKNKLGVFAGNIE